MGKKELSEQDICLRYITPAIEKAGWDKYTQVRVEYSFTHGEIIVRGKLVTRGKQKRADYLLSYMPNVPVAVIEAKDNTHDIGDGIQQAINYAKILDVPFAYASNGDGFLEHDLTTGKERILSLEGFPTPNELWHRYKNAKNIQDKQEEKIISEPYYYKVGSKKPRYYQRIAVNRTIEAIAKGQNRILLVMATGTGKTYTAFQIIWRLYKAGKIKKVLYLADRNILIDQTMINDFEPFKDVMTKVEGRKLNSAYEIHMSLYHQLVGQNGEEIFREFQPNFFDLIIVDEAHRGSARDDSVWRKILEYFDSAIQIGMTATPKETKTVSNIEYFGEPVYTYSLRQGIKDGFLAPYKVIRVGINKDLEGYRPEKGKTDIYGDLVEDREYNIKDYDKNIVIDERTQVVAKRISDYMKETDRFQKTIVFCVDTEHANRMRQALVNENSDLVKENPNYVMRITGNDELGKAQLDNFISVNSKYPVIAVTSKLLSTGVDAKMCKIIALDSNIESLTEFKQIIGRGTRLREQDGKTYFTIMDFREATKLFADPEFDGEPVQIKEVGENEGFNGFEEGSDEEFEGSHDTEFGREDFEGGYDQEDIKFKRKVYINGINVFILNERVQYIGEDGTLITETVRDYSKKNILKKYRTIDDFINKWDEEDKKDIIVEELRNEGVLFEALEEEVGKEFDPFDLILHVAYDKKPLTRSERAKNVKKRGYLYKYSDTARKVLEQILEKYEDEGVLDFDDTKILDLKPFDELGSPLKLVRSFGGKKKFIEATRELKDNLYAS